MGSPVGPLIAKVFLCFIEYQLEYDNKLPIFYKRCVDDTITVMLYMHPPATSFPETLSYCHSSINFKGEIQIANNLEVALSRYAGGKEWM